MALTAQADLRGRPIEFSRSELIKTVTELFWSHGYHDLSLNQIAKKMGLNRSSLYNSFKTKEALFLECLEYYIENSPMALLGAHKEGQSVTDALYRIIDDICRLRSQDKENKGCLVVNIFSEMAGDSTELGQVLIKKNKKKIEYMILLMNRAIQQKELPADADPDVIAKTILFFLNGLNLHAKTGATFNELQLVAHFFLKNIGFNAP